MPLPPDEIPAEALARLLATRGEQPLVTYYDDASGERMELSVRSYENAAAKTANLLRDGFGLDAGARVGVRLPLHWQLPVWLGACWLLGATAVVAADPATVDLLVVGPDEVALEGAPDVVAVSLEPFGMPFRWPLPAGVVDHAVEVRAHGDRFDGPRPDAGDPALELPDGTRLAQSGVLAAAEGVAVAAGLAEGGRLLSARAPVDAPGVLATLAVPLRAAGSVVLVRHEDRAGRDRRRADEHVTAVLD